MRSSPARIRGAPAFKTATVAGTGKVTCSGGTATYDATLEEISTLSYSPACFSAASGGAALNASPCTQIRSNMNDTADTQGSCCYNGTSCNCTMTTTHVNRDVNTLSISGSTISESDGTSYEFCINGSSMSQRESMGGSAYVVTGLTKR